MPTAMKVGALARRTGLTVRTLHHYDEVGLLCPSERTSAGHRLYGSAEIRRLQSIVSLRHIGLSLDQIRDCLDRPEYSLECVLDLQIERIQEQIRRQEQLRELVHHLRRRLHSGVEVSVEELTRTIEVTMKYEKYYSPEQLDRLRDRRSEVGERRIQEVQGEWTALFASFADAMRDGVDPASDSVQQLARKAALLVEEFTGGDAGVDASLGDMYHSEGGDNVVASHGMHLPPGLWEYMGEARAAVSAPSSSCSMPASS